MRNFDRAPHQTDDYIDANYEPDDFTTRPHISDDVKVTVRSAYVSAGLLFPCGECGETCWSTQALEVHRERRHS